MKHRKLLSVLLALVMLLSLAPSAVFADGNGSDDPAAATHDGKVYVVGTEDEELNEDDPTLYDSGTYTRADMDSADEYLTKQFDWTDKDAGEGVITFKMKLNDSGVSTAVYAFTCCAGHGFTKAIAKQNLEYLLDHYDRVDVITVTGRNDDTKTGEPLYTAYYRTSYGDIHIVTGLAKDSDTDGNGTLDYLDLLYGTYTGADWGNGWHGFPTADVSTGYDCWKNGGAHFGLSLYTGLYAYLAGWDNALALAKDGAASATEADPTPRTLTETELVRKPDAIYVSFDGLLYSGASPLISRVTPSGVPYSVDWEVYSHDMVSYPTIPYDCWNILYEYDQSGRYFSMGMDDNGKNKVLAFNYFSEYRLMDDGIIIATKDLGNINDDQGLHYQMWNELIALADPSLLANAKDGSGCVTAANIPTGALWNGEMRKYNANDPDNGDLIKKDIATYYFKDHPYQFDYRYNQSFAALGLPVVGGITLTDTLSDYFDVSSTAATQIEVTAEPADGANVSYTVNGKNVVFNVADYVPGTELTFKIYVTATDAADGVYGWVDTNDSAGLTVQKEDGDTTTQITSPKAHFERAELRDITVTKTWDDDGAQARPDEITFRLLADGTEVANQTVTADDDWTAVFTGLPISSDGEEIDYTVTEDEVPGYTATVSGYNVTNELDLGTLRITKAVTGTTMPGDVAFTITGTPVAKDVTFETVTVTYADFTDGVYTLDGIPTGDYTVTEDVDGAAVNGYTLTVSGDNEETKTLGKNETVEFAIENAYELDRGTLQIVKKTEGAQVPAGTRFTITGTPVAKDVTFETVTVTYEDFTDGVYTLENVPTGEYTVTEDVDGAAVDGYTLSVSGNGETETLGKNGTVDFAIENAYELDLGTLKIVKNAEGAQVPASTRFTITGKPVAKDVTFETVTVRYADFTDGVYTLENVPTGTYTVTEDVDGAALVGYKLTVTGDNGATKTLEKNGTVKFTILNKYERTPSIPDNPTPPPTPELNTKDHYAYIIGYPDGEVKPNGTITRAEVVTVFFRMLTDESRDAIWSTENSFTDVQLTEWFNNAISTMENGGIINGYPDGSFNPNGNITRAEFAAMAIRFFQDAKVGPSKFSDTIGHWAEEAIRKAQNEGLIMGYPDGTFHPDQPITRAEAMTIVNRVLKRAPHKDHLLADMIQWPDNMNKAVWYYADVQEATNSHTYTMSDTTTSAHEIWQKLLPVRDWAAFEKAWSTAHSASNPGEVVNN